MNKGRKVQNTFKQFPLNGSENDYIECIEHLKGYDSLVNSLTEFYKITYL